MRRKNDGVVSDAHSHGGRGALDGLMRHSTDYGSEGD